MKKKIISFLRDQTGEGYVDVAVTVLIVFTLMASLMALTPIFTVQLSLRNTARQLARMAEVTGSAAMATEEVLDTLPAPDSIAWDTDWFNAEDQTIQLKTPFTVTVTRQVSVVIFRPALSDPVSIQVTLRATASGISEVYQKQ